MGVVRSVVVPPAYLEFGPGNHSCAIQTHFSSLQYFGNTYTYIIYAYKPARFAIGQKLL